MADKISMNTQDAVSANFAECFVTLNGTRYSMLMAKEFGLHQHQGSLPSGQSRDRPQGPNHCPGFLHDGL